MIQRLGIHPGLAKDNVHRLWGQILLLLLSEQQAATFAYGEL
jgi:hypothetical protein